MINPAANLPKFKYFCTSARHWVMGKGRVCPACGSRQGTTLSRKYVVTVLRECQNCGLRFRVPTTAAEEAEDFYQEEYSQGWQSSLPSDEEIAHFKDTHFTTTPLTFSHYTNLLQALGLKAGESLYDFGCSWGYGSWQFAQAGFRVTGFEISKPRCAIAREKFGISANPERATGQFDAFFAAHVIEHMPSPSEMIEHALASVRPGGLIVILAPNGSDDFRSHNFPSWNAFWGCLHPNFLHDGYYRKQLGGMPYLLASNPYDLEAIKAWARQPQEGTTLALTGTELLVAVRKPE